MTSRSFLVVSGFISVCSVQIDVSEHRLDFVIVIHIVLVSGPRATGVPGVLADTQTQYEYERFVMYDTH